MRADLLQTQRLGALARRYVDQRRLEAAEKVCRQLLAVDANDVFARTFLASRAMDQGRHDEAIEHRSQLTRSRPADAEAWRLLAAAQQAAGAADAAAQSLRSGLRANPGDARLFAELGVVEAARGRREQAAMLFTHAFILDEALLNARRNPSLPDPLRRLSQAGDDLLNAFHYEANRELVEQLAEQAGAPLPERWHRFLRRFHQREPIRYATSLQQPDYHYYEGLAAQPFWPREQFPWLVELEAATDDIRAEFLAAMQQGTDGFAPYVEAHPDAPAAWQAMSGKMTWASMHLIRGNQPVAENVDRCPVTAALLQRLPLARATGHAPEVFFSVLEPGTHIPPHHGVANTKLAIHLPLIIPDHCAIRVGGELRGWTEGECLVFDDSFLHEAWNRSDQRRVVLILETWHPELTALEIDALRAIIARGDDWYARCRDAGIEELTAA